MRVSLILKLLVFFYVFSSCVGEGVNVGVVVFTDQDSFEFKHVITVYDSSTDTQTFEFCDLKLSNRELDTLESVLKGAVIPYTRLGNVVKLSSTEVKDMLEMSSLDGELRYRMNYEGTNCPDQKEIATKKNNSR